MTTLPSAMTGAADDDYDDDYDDGVANDDDGDGAADDDDDDGAADDDDDAAVIDCVDSVPPPTPKLTKRNKKLIPLNNTAFHLYSDGVTYRHQFLTNGRRMCLRYAEKIITAILDNNLNEQQQVLALRTASTHNDIALHFRSAGLIDNKEYDTMKHISSQVRSLVTDTLKTNNKRGRANDDKRFFFNLLFLELRPHHRMIIQAKRMAHRCYLKSNRLAFRYQQEEECL